MEKNTATKALSFIFITLLIDCTGLGVIIPVTPKLIQELTGGDISEASRYGGWLTFSYAIMQFLFSSVLGGLSDRFGRRPVLLISLFGLGVDYIFLALAPSIFWLFIGRMIAGISGASFTTATAYIADISTPEKRAQNFGMVGAAFGIGFILGPVLGGVFSQFGTRVPFIIAAALSLLNFLYGYFVLPESLSKENRRAFDIKRANPIGSLINLRRHKEIVGLMVIIFFINIAGQSPQSTWTYYTMLKFGWNEVWVGYSLGFIGLTIGIVQGGLIRVIIPKIGQRKAVFLGLMLSFTGYILFSFATQGWMMFAFMVPFALGGLAGPALQGIISNRVPANEQGEIQGTLTSLMSIASIIGPVMMTSMFSFCTKPGTLFYFPGISFFVSAVIVLFCLLISMRALSAVK